MRHLLTHTAGIGYWRRLSDLLRPGVGPGDRAGRQGAARLAEYYRKGLPVEVEPGTKWLVNLGMVGGYGRSYPGGPPADSSRSAHQIGLPDLDALR